MAVEFPLQERGCIGSPMMNARSGDPMMFDTSGFHLTKPEDGHFRGRAVDFVTLLREGVDIRYDCTVEDIAPSDSGVTANCFQDISGNALGLVGGAMIVGADGLSSRARSTYNSVSASFAH